MSCGIVAVAHHHQEFATTRGSRTYQQQVTTAPDVTNCNRATSPVVETVSLDQQGGILQPELKPAELRPIMKSSTLARSKRPRCLASGDEVRTWRLGTKGAPTGAILRAWPPGLDCLTSSVGWRADRAAFSI